MAGRLSSKSTKWRWASARALGTSHKRNGILCQDYSLCREVNSRLGSTLIAVVADGAGSAARSLQGAKRVCASFVREASQFVAAEGDFSTIATKGIAEQWIDAIRDQIYRVARRANAPPRDFASTLVAAVAGPAVTVIIHVGDGAAVVRSSPEEDWKIPSWPFQGEYASTTHFVTDDPFPHIAVHTIEAEVTDVVLFSDGLERMILDYRNKLAHAPFFNHITRPLAHCPASGLQIDLSHALQRFLESSEVCERTDDDKTLIIAVKR
jgi:hypothetical protein